MALMPTSDTTSAQNSGLLHPETRFLNLGSIRLYMHMSELLPVAATGWTFWFDVQQGVGYWNSTTPSIADPRPKSENGLVHIRSDETRHYTLATTTPEQLACVLAHIAPMQGYLRFKNLSLGCKSLELCVDVASGVDIKAKSRPLRFL